MEKTTIASIASIAVVILSFIIGTYLYFSCPLPEKMASHWNIEGLVDGYMPTFWGLFLMPIISLILLALFIIIPKIDPLKANIAKFKSYYSTFIFAIILFLFYLHILTLVWNMGIRFNMVSMMSPAFATLFFYCGIVLENAKRNWFIGIRTPWTLSNDNVWAKTHRLGGKLYKASGILSLVGVILPNYAIIFILVPIIIASIYLVVYSYVEYNKQIKTKKRF